MTFVTLLRELLRHRWLLLLGVVVAVMAELAMMYRIEPGFPPKFEARQYDSGVATAEVLVDSPSSQVVDLGGGEEIEGAAIDISGLSTRARLLTSLIATNPLKDRIANAAGLPSGALKVDVPATETMAIRIDTAEEQTSPDDRDALILHLYVDPTLPIISMEAEAPDAPTATRIAGAAVTELRDYLESVASAASVPDVRQLVVVPLGPAASATVVKGPSEITVLAAIAVLGLWCAGLILIPRARAMWRELDRLDQLAAPAAAAPVAVPARAETADDADESADVEFFFPPLPEGDPLHR